MNMNLFLMDISDAGNTSGVDRYLEQYIECLGERHPYIRVHRIQLVNDNRRMFYNEEYSGASVKITIPMPQNSENIIRERYWGNKYNEQVYRLCAHLFAGKQHCIVHIHTLNLISLAMYIKKRIPCKVVTHLHCMPWKGLYNIDIARFNRLYRNYYICKEGETNASDYMRSDWEVDAYRLPDRVICITRGAKDFLVNVMRVEENNISVIYNGCKDYRTFDRLNTVRDDDSTHLIFVGVWNPGKGLEFILEAMRKVSARGYKISLTIAGKYTSDQYGYITRKYRDLSLDILGRISFERFSEYYAKSDIGIIASLQEQMSLVALEMAMFGLPVITTATDGMDEIFTDGEDAIKINLGFSILSGLSVDTDILAEKIIGLIKNKEKRETLGRNIRRLYREKFTIEMMTDETVDVYFRLLNR